MADIEILVDSSQVKTAKQDIQDLGNSFNSAAKSASVYMQTFAKAAAQSARDANYIRDVARANQEVINKNLKVSNSYSSAEASAAAFTEELRKQELQAQKTARANQDAINKQLGVSGSPATSSGAGFGAIENEILRLEAMYNKVALAARVYEQAQESLNRAVLMGVVTADQKEAKLQELTLAYQKVGNSADLAQTFIDRFGENAQVSGRGLNQFGLYAQQVGYQVGDFLVQIQSGTNVLVAFGQQATQLAGLIPGVWGAALGIGISLATALGAAFMRTGEAAKESAGGIETLDDRLKSLNQTLQTWVMSKKAASMGLTVEELVGTESVDKALSDMAAAEIAYNRLLESARNPAMPTSTDPAGAMGVAIANLFAVGSAEADIESARQAYANAVETVGTLQSKLLEERLTNFKQEKAALLESQAIEQATLKYGEDSLEVRALTADQERNRYNESLKNLELNSTMVDLLMEQYDTGAAVVAEYEKLPPLQREINEYAQQFAQTDLASGVDAAAAAALALAQRLNISLDAAKGMMALGYGAPVVYDPRDPNFDPAKASAGRAEQLQKDRFGFSYSTTVQGTKFADDKKGGGGREDKLRKQIDLTKELTQAEKDRQTILQSIEGSLESGFMAMVDGTKSVKDAFKSMAAEIIKELYRVLVVQRLVGGISGAVNMLTLPAGPSTGTLGLPKFATGGSMMPGGSYIVGENGPELVIPRHSGTVVNANQTANAMGGGGGFTQNLSINVSGSDATMVRTEIAKMIPQITNATKAAVIDAKQRGGQMAQAFR